MSAPELLHDAAPGAGNEDSTPPNGKREGERGGEQEANGQGASGSSRSHRSHSHHSHRSHSSSHSSSRSASHSAGQRQKHGQHRKRRHGAGKGIERLFSRLSHPVAQCRRCNERYYASWHRDLKCPKCGRRPAHAPLWESALCFLLPPVALFDALRRKGESPRSAARILLYGLCGALVYAGLYFFMGRH